MTAAACQRVFPQRLKRSGMAWTIAGGQIILDLRVIRLSRVWEKGHQRYLTSKPMPVAQLNTPKGAQYGKKAAEAFGSGAITPLQITPRTAIVTGVIAFSYV